MWTRVANQEEEWGTPGRVGEAEKRAKRGRGGGGLWTWVRALTIGARARKNTGALRDRGPSPGKIGGKTNFGHRDPGGREELFSLAARRATAGGRTCGPVSFK